MTRSPIIDAEMPRSSPLSPTTALVPRSGEHPLHHLRLAGVLYCQARLTAPWGLALPQLDGHMILLFLTSGRCEVEIDDQVHRLEPGDFLLLPHGSACVTRSDAEARVEALFDIAVTKVSDTYERTEYGGGGEESRAMCCVLRFDHPAADYLLSALPRVLRLCDEAKEQLGWLRGAMRQIESEVEESFPGGEAIVSRLADVLCVITLRAFLDDPEQRQSGYLAALADPGIGRCLAQVHSHPEKDWTLEALARLASMSRTRFVDTFSALVGETPMKYLTFFRMQEARLLLQRRDLSIGQLSSRFGYESEAAFSRAFKRVLGVSPSAVRKAIVNRS